MLRFAVPVLFVVIWSTGFIVAKAAMPHANLQLFLIARLMVVSGILAVLAWIVGAAWPKPREAGFQLTAGALLQGVYLCFSYWAISRGLPAGVMALLGALQPLFTALFVAASGSTLACRTWMGLVIGFSGVACVLAPKLSGIGVPSLSPIAVAAAMLSVAGVTAGSLLQKSLVTVDLRVSASLQNLGGALVACALSLAGGDWYWDGSFALWVAFSWSVLIASIVGVTLLMWMLRHNEATRVTSLVLAVPPLAALQGLWLFGEVLGPTQLLGFVLALGGLMLARSGPPPVHQATSLKPAE